MTYLEAVAVWRDQFTGETEHSSQHWYVAITATDLARRYVCLTGEPIVGQQHRDLRLDLREWIALCRERCTNYPTLVSALDAKNSIDNVLIAAVRVEADRLVYPAATRELSNFCEMMRRQ